MYYWEGEKRKCQIIQWSHFREAQGQLTIKDTLIGREKQIFEVIFLVQPLEHSHVLPSPRSIQVILCVDEN